MLKQFLNWGYQIGFKNKSSIDGRLSILDSIVREALPPPSSGDIYLALKGTGS
jgi:hypothetical protein